LVCGGNCSIGKETQPLGVKNPLINTITFMGASECVFELGMSVGNNSSSLSFPRLLSLDTESVSSARVVVVEHDDEAEAVGDAERTVDDSLTIFLLICGASYL
jgi:stage III sporulation protein SpoIIIAA